MNFLHRKETAPMKYMKMLTIVIMTACLGLLSLPSQAQPGLADTNSTVLSDQEHTDSENDTLRNKKPEYFRNHVYVEVWGHAIGSINYNRWYPKYNFLIGGGLSLTPWDNFFDFEGINSVNIFVFKQLHLIDKFQYGIGLGGTYNFRGEADYSSFWDPFFVKIGINRFSKSPADDRLYYGISLYYTKWHEWNIRPSFKFGFSL